MRSRRSRADCRRDSLDQELEVQLLVWGKSVLVGPTANRPKSNQGAKSGDESAFGIRQHNHPAN